MKHGVGEDPEEQQYQDIEQPLLPDSTLNERAKLQTISFTLLLVLGMLATGTTNTLLNKWQDRQCVAHCNDPSEAENFEQPIYQTLNMFIGEFLCFIVYLFTLIKNKPETESPVRNFQEINAQGEEHNLLRKQPLIGVKNLLIILPTLCDITATTLMNVGLLTVSASIYQMLRGAVVIFTGILSLLCLRIPLPLYRIYALTMVLIGVAVVGASPTLFGPHKALSGSLWGISLILVAQLFTACQFVIEEWIMTKYHVSPLKIVGLEGLYGCIMIAFLMIILHFSNGTGYFDISIGFYQLISNPILWGSSIVFAFSITFFNWFGLNITKYVSATSRSTIDTCRTLFIWIFSLALGWETFIGLQVFGKLKLAKLILGFLVLIYGTFVFNDVIEAIPSRIKNLFKR